MAFCIFLESNCLYLLFFTGFNVTFLMLSFYIAGYQWVRLMATGKCDVKQMPTFGYAVSRTIAYILILTVVIISVSFLFGWKTLEEIPPYLVSYSSVLLFVNPYIKYIQAVLVFGLGYLVVNSTSGTVYTYVRRISDHANAATLRTITRIAGIAVLLSLMLSVFNVDAAAALTVGSFGGLVVGFATQTILTHVVAGIFLLISRPFTYGDVVTVSSQTGKVKEIKLMHVVLETEDSENDILIPSGTIVTQIIKKKLPGANLKPLRTVTTLDELPVSVNKGSIIILSGKLVEQETDHPLSEKTVKIFDEDIGRDDLLAVGVTNADGTFAISWKARKTDFMDNTVEIYAKFEGDDKYRCSNSKTFKLTVK
jgi:small-conductance mechanosensitive channel